MFRVVNQTLEESSKSRLKGRESERFTRKQFQIFLLHEKSGQPSIPRN
jgi:hypothetical protein